MTAKDLKNALLQEAVMGKLVPQIASEGNARDLLEEIKKNHTDLQISTKSAGTDKKNSDLRSKSQIRVIKKEVAPITDEEVPFDIPESWCWCRLGELVFNHGQKTPDKEFSYIDIGSIDNEHQKLNSKENFIMPEKAPSRARKIVEEGDVIYSTVRPYLHNMCIIDKKFTKEPIASTGFAVMASKEIIYNKYLFYYLLSPIFDNYANDTDNAKGVAYPAINDDKLYKGIVPLPPLAEQKRIVAAIEKFMPLIEEYGKKESALNLLNTQIASLTKKAILQEAVQGRLVPQIATEGNAKDLLAEIKKSHTDLQISTKSAGIDKKNSDLRSKSQIRVTKKEVAPITDEEVPFDIPESWCWCRLGEIIDTNIGLTYSPTDIVTNGGTAVLRSNNIQDGKIVYEDLVHVSKKVPEKCLSKKGDLLICARNGSKALVGKAALIEQDGMAFGAFMALIRSPINPFILHFINSPVYRAKLEGVNTTTINQITQDNLRETLFPLPPLAEQKRIVAAIEKLLPLCKKLGQ